MPEMTIDIPIRNLAYIINGMGSQELETLYMFLTEEGTELLERNRDLELLRGLGAGNTAPGYPTRSENVYNK